MKVLRCSKIVLMNNRLSRADIFNFLKLFYVNVIIGLDYCHNWKEELRRSILFLVCPSPWAKLSQA